MITNVEFSPSRASDRIALIECFVAVAETLSFAKAAVALAMTPSAVSRRVARLEARLHVRLLERTTRTVALTEEGRLYLGYCKQILEQLETADSVVRSHSLEPSGVLRISVPVALGRLYVQDIVTEYLQRFPKVHAVVDFSDRYVNLLEEKYDVAVRIGSLDDSGLIARRIAPNMRVLVASREYVLRNGLPETPADLAAHNCLCYSHYPSLGTVWRFMRGDETAAVKASISMMSNSSEAVFSAVTRGMGIGLVARYIIPDAAIDSGELVEVLPGWEPLPRSDIYVLFSNRQLTAKARTFIDHLVATFARIQNSFVLPAQQSRATTPVD